jgi:hypothetical protein
VSSRGGATLALKITGDAKDGIRALDDAEDRTSRFSSSMGKLGGIAAAGLAGAAAGFAVLGKASFDAASDLEQSTGAIDAVFGDWALDIEQSAQRADQAVGLSTSAYENLAAVIGAQLAGAGFAHDQMTDKTQNLIEKGADLAATFGGTTAEAVEALSSVLKGETDPIERYGVSLKQSDISARLAAEGHDKLTGTALKTATANAALALVMEQTKASTGAFAKEGDTAAGKSERLAAWFENLKAKLGAGLLPIFVKAADFIQTKVAPVIERLTVAGGPLSQMFGQVGAFITGQLVPALSSLWEFIQPKVIPVLEHMGHIVTDFLVPAFVAIWGVIQTYVIPIFKSVLGPVLDGVQTLWGKLEGALERNKDKFSGLLEKVKPLLEFLRDKVAPFIGGALKLGFEAVATVIGKVVDAIAWVLDKAAAVGGFIGKVGGFLFGGAAGGHPAAGAVRGAPVFGAAPGGLFGASTPLFGAGAGPSGVGQGPLIAAGDTYNITVTGALDPAAVADQIGRLLDQRARRIGAAPAFGVRIA